MDPWIYYALGAALASGLSRLATRVYLKDEEDTWAFAVVFGLVSGLLLFPLSFLDWKFNLLPQALVLTALAAIAWAVYSLFSFESSRLLEVSQSTPIYRTRLVWASLIGFFFLGDSMPAPKAVGILLVFLGGLAIVFGNSRLDLKSRGVRVTLYSAVSNSVAQALDKLALAFYSPLSYSWVAFFVPACILLPFTKNPGERLSKIIRHNGEGILVVAALTATQAALLYTAISLTQLSNALPVYELNIVIASIGGVFLLKENKEIGRKVIGLALAVLGAILVGVS
jgi:uncharacterized membrane protein